MQLLHKLSHLLYLLLIINYYCIDVILSLLGSLGVEGYHRVWFSQQFCLRRQWCRWVVQPTAIGTYIRQTSTVGAQRTSKILVSTKFIKNKYQLWAPTSMGGPHQSYAWRCHIPGVTVVIVQLPAPQIAQLKLHAPLCAAAINIIAFALHPGALMPISTSARGVLTYSQGA